MEIFFFFLDTKVSGKREAKQRQLRSFIFVLKNFPKAVFDVLFKLKILRNKKDLEISLKTHLTANFINIYLIFS